MMRLTHRSFAALRRLPTGERYILDVTGCMNSLTFRRLPESNFSDWERRRTSYRS